MSKSLNQTLKSNASRATVTLNRSSQMVADLADDDKSASAVTSPPDDVSNNGLNVG